MLIPISSRPIAYTTYQVPNTICLLPTTYLVPTYKIGTYLLQRLDSSLICIHLLSNNLHIHILLHSTYSTVSTHTSKYLKWLHDAIHYLAFVVALHVYIHLFWPWIMVHTNDLSFRLLVMIFGYLKTLVFGFYELNQILIENLSSIFLKTSSKTCIPFVFRVCCVWRHH